MTVVVESVEFTGWTITVNDRTFYFPATGVRDMGVKERKVSYGTFPGFSSITYIATSGFHGTVTYDENAGSSCLILAIDKREGDFKTAPIPFMAPTTHTALPSAPSATVRREIKAAT